MSEMRKLGLIALVMFGLLASLIVDIQSVEVAKANPFEFKIMDEVPPDNSTYPPTILILTPQNSTTYNKDNMTLSINVETGYSATAAYAPHPYIAEIFYKIDNQNNPTTIYQYGRPEYGSKTFTKFNTTINIENIPQGNHSIAVYAIETGRYEKTGPIIVYYPFKITGSASAYFTIDNAASPTSTPTQSPQPTPTITPMLTPETTPPYTPTPPKTPNTSSPSPTQTPTLEPSLTASSTQPPHSRGDEDFIYTVILIVVGLVALAVMVGIAVYHKRRRE